MTSHRNHDHPATPAARAACRKANHTWTHPLNANRNDEAWSKARFIDEVPGYDQVTGYAPCMEQRDHCSGCGKVDPHTVSDQYNIDYSLCCDELVVHGICNGTHKPPVGA